MSDRYFKDFDGWNKVKKITNKHPRAPFYKEGEIWWTRIGINIGHEIDGKGELFLRPVLIIRKYNSLHFLGVPTSTKLKNNPYYLIVTIDSKIVSILISQVRSLSSLRLVRKLYELELVEFTMIRSIVASHIENSSSCFKGGVVGNPNSA